MDDSGRSGEKASRVEGHGCVFRGQVVFGYPPKPRRRCNSGCPQNRGNSKIGTGQVYRWKKLFVEDGGRAFPGNGKPRDAELAELRKENKNLREERDILRKAVAIFSKPPR